MKEMILFHSCRVFFFWQDGHDGEDPKQSTADMTVFVSSSTFSE